jgi:hypothetical protein
MKMSSPSAKLFEWYRTDVELHAAQSRLKAALAVSRDDPDVVALQAVIAVLASRSAQLLAELHHLRMSSGCAD